MNTITFPPVEKGVPLPVPVAARVKLRGRPLAPWRLFLAGLAPGDSFKVLETSMPCLRGHAAALGLDLTMRRTGEMADHNTPVLRVWRL